MALKRNWAGEVRNISVLIAIGGGAYGFEQILGVTEGEKRDLQSGVAFYAASEIAISRTAIDLFPMPDAVCS